MDEVKTDCVICPACCHQFVAIPLDVQQEIKTLHEDVRRMEAMQRAITYLQDERDEWKHRAKAVYAMYRRGAYNPEADKWFEEE